jgi:hypothetical protein
MRILQPYDLSQVTLDSLIEQKKVLPVQGNKIWNCSIFPLSKTVSTLDHLDKDHQITLVDDSLFADFIVLDKIEQTILINNNTGRKLIRTSEFGTFEDSIKRYNQLDKPIDYNQDAQTFLNIPVTDPTLVSQMDVRLNDLVHRPDGLDEFIPRKKLGIFDSVINHPHLTYPAAKKNPYKNNDKKIILEVFKWAKEKGIKYIYCINEYRPYIINQSYTTPFVYYTVRGSL